VARETADTAATESSPWVSPDGAIVFVLDGEAAGRSLRAPARPGQVLRVGKAPDNDLVLGDKTVSRYHLEIVRAERWLLVRDLGSRNGSLVGGVRVREAILEPGALITVGDTRLLLRVDLDGAVVPPSPSNRFRSAIGQSIAMRRIFGLLERVAPTDATVLLTGETGTGKDVLASSVHAASARGRGPFEILDCAAISPTLIESELFGHERGAFTGAVHSHVGAFERARGGTLFLDELGELPLALQPKLLRALEARQVRRVGGSRAIDVDVRILAATTRNLVDDVRRGSFREDLYFRLAVIHVHVPPLRDRAEDIVPLAEHLLATQGGGRLTLSPEVLAQLRSYPWPGNVRELRNVLERAAVLARADGGAVIDELGLSPAAPDGPVADLFTFPDDTTYRDARARVEAAFERRFVAWILGRSAGNVAAAARMAKMDRKYLADLVRKHGL
jgi:transcriptional regulator with GAF, ATPase, and Fis domain